VNQKRSPAELVFLTILPVFLLLCSTCYLLLIDRLLLSPYLMLCLSGLSAVIGCLLWGSGLTLRIIRRGSAGGMALVSVLLTLWSLLYLLSGLLATVPHALYLLTCAALVPPALLPAALFRTFHAALQPADKQKPGRVFWILFGVGIFGVLIALTDPLHHLVFPVVSGDLTYGIPMYLIYGWFCIASLGCQIYLLASRFSARTIPALILTVLEAVAFLLLILEFFDLSLLTMAYATPLLLYGFCALAIDAELLPDGRDWPDLLQRATFPVQLMDVEGTILCGSDRAAPLAANHKAAILNNRYRVSQIMDKDTQLSASIIPGGFALHQKDLRDLHALQDALDSVTAELNEANAFLARESELEENLQRLTKKNDFFSEQAAKIQEKTDRASLLLRCAAAPDPEPGFRRTVVTRANVLVTYIQQLGRLLQASKESDQLPVRELRAAVGAGYLYAICGTMRTMPGLGSSPAAERIGVDDDGRVTGLF